MAAAEAFDFAPKFEIAANSVIIEDAEAVDDGCRFSKHIDDLIRMEI